MLRNGFLIGLLWLSGLASLHAATVYDLPKEGNRLVRRMHYHEVQEGQTLAQIAGQYDVGFLALMAANKGVDPFLPKRVWC
ncbi:LysM peptidoglycan-binding domain-containing protein [Vibrio metschnikovii]